MTLSTLHAAKGLEWPHVVLAGVNEGLPQAFQSGSEVAGADDARARLCRKSRRPAMYGHHASPAHAGGEHAAPAQEGPRHGRRCAPSRLHSAR
ncbi:MAG: hypothetical protein IPI51_13665 [Betaproteobacteria bacterium]|nr:hypothetical protein [Betaproteobacteria bacterium]